MTEINRIGFIGAGLMGFGMAKCLLKNGLEVNVLPHKNSEPIEKLKNLGARVAKDYRDLLLDTNGLISCLPNAEIVEKLAKELVTEFKPGMFWIDTTTSKPATSKKIAVLLQEKGVFFADAPVTGGPAQSIEGQLASLVGCDQDDFPKVEEIVGLYSRVVRYFGVVGSGNIAKLLNNLVSQGMVILLADAFLSAEIMGVNRQALYDVMEAGAVRSGTLEKMVKPYLSGNYDGSQFS
ncbi:MAG: NAD(P)-dependent oxidoreductase, partial [Rhodobacteraceae bacterium]|nr:NAD(P)-dependent oxidoreductase [Paracoccaceae bacterium]